MAESLYLNRELKSLQQQYKEHQLIISAIKSIKQKSIPEDGRINKENIIELIHTFRMIKFVNVPSNIKIIDFPFIIQKNLSYQEQKFIKTNIIENLKKILEPAVALKQKMVKNDESIKDTQNKIIASKIRLEELKEKLYKIQSEKLILLKKCAEIKYRNQKENSHLELVSSEMNNLKATLLENVVKQQIFKQSEYAPKAIKAVNDIIQSRKDGDKKLTEIK